MDTDDLLSRLLDVLHDAAAADGVLPSEPTLADQLGSAGRTSVRSWPGSRPRASCSGGGAARRSSTPPALDLVARFDQTFDYADMLTALGHEAGVDVLGADLVPLDAVTAEAFGRPEGTIALRTVKRWRADGRPAMAAVNLVPMPDGTTSVPPDVTTSVFDFAAKVAGEAVVWTIARPGAIALDDREPDGWTSRSAKPCSPSNRSASAAAAGPVHERRVPHPRRRALRPRAGRPPALTPTRPSPADSSSGRDELVESFGWSIPSEGLSGSSVEEYGEVVEVVLGVD